MPLSVDDNGTKEDQTRILWVQAASTRLESMYRTFSSVLNTNRINDRIALNVNADKATVLGKPPGSHSSRLELNNNIISGAALHGASLSRQFENMMSVSTTYKLLMQHLQLLPSFLLLVQRHSRGRKIL